MLALQATPPRVVTVHFEPLSETSLTTQEDRDDARRGSTGASSVMYKSRPCGWDADTPLMVQLRGKAESQHGGVPRTAAEAQAVDRLWLEARAAFQQGRMQEAVALGRRVIECGNSSRLPDGYHLLALAQASTEGIDEGLKHQAPNIAAANAAAVAVALRPRVGKFRNTYGEALRRAGELQKGIAQLYEAVR